MVYESDFYTTRRPYSRPLVSSYSVTGGEDPPVTLPLSTILQLRSVPHMPYVAHKRLVTVIHTPVRTVYYAGAMVPIRVHARVRPSVLAAELNRIRSMHRPSSQSYTEKFLNSRDLIYFDDEAKEIRARVDSLLRRVHVFVPRAVASDFAEEIVPERMRSGDYVRRLISGKNNAKKEADPVSWYEVPERGNFGNLACVKYVAGKPQSVRKPYFKVADLRPSDIRNDVNFLSYYSKNRQAAAKASPEEPMTERELRKARALQAESGPEQRKAVKAQRQESVAEAWPEKKLSPVKETPREPEPEPVSQPEPEPEPVKEPEPEPEPAKEPEPVKEPVKQPEPVKTKKSKARAKVTVAAAEPAKAEPEAEPVPELKQPEPVVEAKEPEPLPEPLAEPAPEPAVEPEPEPEPVPVPEPAKEEPAPVEDTAGQNTEAVSETEQKEEEKVKQDKEEAKKKIEEYLIRAAEEAKSEEERKKEAEEARLQLELEEQKAWEALQAAQERALHLDEIRDQELAIAERNAEESKMEADRLEAERVLEAERQIQVAQVTALLQEQEKMIVEEHLEEVRRQEEKEELLANVAVPEEEELDCTREDLMTVEVTDHEKEERPYELIIEDETRVEEVGPTDEERLETHEPFVEEPEGTEQRFHGGAECAPTPEEVMSGAEESFEWGDSDA